MRIFEKSGYVLLVVALAISISVSADTPDEIVESMRSALQDSFNEIQLDKSGKDCRPCGSRIFKSFADSSSSHAQYLCFKSKKSTFFEGYGTMYKRMEISYYSFSDSAECDSFFILLLGMTDTGWNLIHKPLFDSGFVALAKSPPFIMLKASNWIVRVEARCLSFQGPLGSVEDWKKMAKELLGYPNIADVDKIVFCHCGGPLLLADSTYFTYDSIMPPGTSVDW